MTNLVNMLHEIYVKNDHTTRKLLGGTHIFGYHNYYSLNNMVCKAK